MRHQIISVLIFSLISFGLKAQFEPTNDGSSSTPVHQGPKTKEQPKPLKERLVIGGGLDLQFGNYTVIGLTPLVGYKVTDKFLAGGIFTYRYIQDNRYNPSYSASTYGVTPFARYTIFKGLFAHAEYEMLYGKYFINDSARWINSLLVGGGYGTPLGNNGFVGVYVLWNVTPNADYPLYEKPVIRMSFGIGL
jgi:hypothetical protein